MSIGMDWNLNKLGIGIGMEIVIGWNWEWAYNVLSIALINRMLYKIILR